jgi:PIN domain nuclease of toxin-antitoxin system
MSNGYILDTHIFIWSIDAPANLSSKAKETLLTPSNQFFPSRVSYWEICIK